MYDLFATLANGFRVMIGLGLIAFGTLGFIGASFRGNPGWGLQPISEGLTISAVFYIALGVLVTAAGLWLLFGAFLKKCGIRFHASFVVQFTV